MMIRSRDTIIKHIISARDMRKYCGAIINKVHQLTGVTGSAINGYTSVLFKSADFDKLKILDVNFSSYKDTIMLSIGEESIQKILGDQYAV